MHDQYYPFSLMAQKKAKPLNNHLKLINQGCKTIEIPLNLCVCFFFSTGKLFQNSLLFFCYFSTVLMIFSQNFVPISYRLLVEKIFTEAKIQYLFYKYERKKNQEIIKLLKSNFNLVSTESLALLIGVIFFSTYLLIIFVHSEPANPVCS